MRRLDRRGRLAFENVADDDAPISCPIDRRELLAKFHARLPNGEIVSGARAFCEAYGVVPYLSWAKALGRFTPSRWLLDRLYLGFLRIRPTIQRLVARADRRHAQHSQ
ncbi:MAG: DCC1-like thiol-disulfide oxidoreductase family protein [Pseudomonadota bacterium]